MKRLLTCLALLGFGTFATAAEPVYATDIRPILADNCYECHGPDKAKGGLRLDSPDGIRAGSKQRAVIIPGNPGKSPLYTVTMLPPNDDDFMPAKGEPLKAVQQDLLKAWIAAGAKFGDGAPASTPRSNAPPPPRPGIPGRRRPWPSSWPPAWRWRRTGTAGWSTPPTSPRG